MDEYKRSGGNKPKNINKKLKVIVIPGLCNKFLYFVSKFTPRWLYYKVAIKGWELMD